jgi:plastocyanin
MARQRRRNKFVIVAQSGPGDIESSSHSQMAPPSMRSVLPITVFVALAVTAPVCADEPSYAIELKNNQFLPSEVQIPAGVKVKLVVTNHNPTVSEFESTQFHREKVVSPGQEIAVFVGPLDPGSYEFFDDFHPQTRGQLIVK